MKKIALLIVVALVAIVGIGVSMTSVTFSMEAAGKKSKDIQNTDLSIVSRDIKIRDFSVLDVAGNMTVVYTCGSKAAMTVSGPKYFLDNMVVEIKGNTMKIGYTEEFYKRNSNRAFSWKDLFDGDSKKKGVRVTLSSPSLNKVSASLSAKFTTDILNSNDRIELYASTSADIKAGSVTARSLKATASTSGDVKIGSVDASSSATLDAQTSGDVKIGSLTTDILGADASTSGDVKIRELTADRVTASASTSGDVELAGTADSVTFSASTSGDIKAGALTARNATVSASTSGDVKYCARNTVNKTKGGIHNTYND